MTRRSNDFQLALIALLAMAGMLSFSGVASAETAGTAAHQANRSCCANRVCPPGCCAPRGNSTRSGSNGQWAAKASRASAFLSGDSSCECRSSELASPAARSGSKSVDRLPGLDRGEVVSRSILPAELGRPTRLIEPDPWPPKSPLYLTTERLII